MRSMFNQRLSAATMQNAPSPSRERHQGLDVAGLGLFRYCLLLLCHRPGLAAGRAAGARLHVHGLACFACRRPWCWPSLCATTKAAAATPRCGGWWPGGGGFGTAPAHGTDRLGPLWDMAVNPTYKAFLG